MSAIVIAGVRYQLRDAEERLDARLALIAAGLDRVSLDPPDGREFGVDGLFSYEGLIDASHFERAQLELYRLRHMHEGAPEFMGYTYISPRFVLISVVEKYERVQSPGTTSEADIEASYRAALSEAEHAFDLDAFDRELDMWARSRPARVVLERSECP